MSDLRTDSITLTRDLAVAVRFVDPFTNQPVRAPFSVSIAALNWAAWWVENDATYRFSLANAPLVGGAPQLPVGTFDLELALPGRENAPADPLGALPRGPYADFETRQVTLPLPAPHSPPVPTDYRVDLALWPTVAFRVPPGETAVVGRVVSASQQFVVGLKVILLDASVPPPPNPPYARSDGAGQFLVRLPGLRRDPAASPTANLSVQLFDPANAPIVVVPAILTVPIGQVTSFIGLNIP